jgi:hypothetical protein
VPEYQPGDKVELTYVGDVQCSSGQGRWVTLTSGHAFDTVGGEVRLLEKAAPKVGDKIDSRWALRNLPVGSAVTNSYGNVLLVTPFGSIGKSGNYADLATGSDNPPYTVIHLGR